MALINYNENVDQSLIMLKPDIVDQNLVLPLIMSLSGKFGLNITNIIVVELNKEQAKEFYYNAHENRLNKLETRIQNENLSEDVINSEKLKFDEIHDRNSNFISSGKMVALEVVNKSNNREPEDYINFIRQIVDEDLRKSYSSNHEEYTFACNGIHASDSVVALKRDLDFLETYIKKNRNLTLIYPKQDMPERKIPDENDYIKSFLLKEFNTAISDMPNTPVGALAGYKGFKSIMTGYQTLLNNYANDPNISNALLLKNATDFVLNGVNKSNYTLKNEQQQNTLNGVENIIQGCLDVSPKLKKSLELIDSKVSGVIDQTIGKHRHLFFQMHTNKPFIQQNTKKSSIEPNI